MHQIWPSLVDDVMNPVSSNWKWFDRSNRRKLREIISNLCETVCCDEEKADKLVGTMKGSRSLNRFVEETLEVERLKQKMMMLQSTLQDESTLKHKQQPENQQQCKVKEVVKVKTTDTYLFLHTKKKHTKKLKYLE